MDSKIEPICSDVKEIKNHLDHLEQDVTILKNDMSNFKYLTIKKFWIHKFGSLNLLPYYLQK